MRPIIISERAKARRADSAPGPSLLVLFPPIARSLIWRALIPSSYKTSEDKSTKLYSERMILIIMPITYASSSQKVAQI